VLAGQPNVVNGVATPLAIAAPAVTILYVDAGLRCAEIGRRFNASSSKFFGVPLPSFLNSLLENPSIAMRGSYVGKVAIART
jgi:hypothetical protein